MGMDSELTLEQRDVLNKVRESLQDLLAPEQDDEYILRFVIARKYDVEASVQMLRRHLTFWKKNHFDEILSNFTLEKKSNYFFTTILGFDKEGSLVRWLRIGQTDLKGMVLSHTMQDSLNVAIYYLAHDLKLQKQRRETQGDGKDCKMTYILDLQGLPWSCLVSRPLITQFITLLRAYESNFPEYLKMAYILNAPSFFNLILNFVKSVLPSEILNKVVILSAGKSNLSRKSRIKLKIATLSFSSRKFFTQTSADVLRSIIDESILPASLGGTLKSPDDDPTCPHLFAIPPGTQVPEEFYLASCVTSLEGDPEAKKTVVLNQASFSVELEVSNPNSTIFWDFETTDNDIGMGLKFKKEGEEEFKEIMPVHRVNSHRITESGRYDCKERGIYELFFDNTYSWWAKKELTYKVKVESNDTTSVIS